MPELPEVTTIVRELRATVRGKSIRDVSVDAPKLVRPLTTVQFRAAVRGKKFLRFERRGKFILAWLGGGAGGKGHSPLSQRSVLLWHMGMTGHPLFRDPPSEAGNRRRRMAMADPINGHIRLTFFFTDGTRLEYSDVRKFGKVEFLEMTDPLRAHRQLKKLGPDALDLARAPRTLCARLHARHKFLKVALLDQEVLAGVGNIYADEALWNARLHPLLPTRALTKRQCRALARALGGVLATAIRAGGTSIDDYRRLLGVRGNYGHLCAAYQRTGLPCRRCGTLIRRLVVGGRGTHICPRCQRVTATSNS